MSNPDWPGPYWQDDASAGRRGRRDDLSQQSPWEDAGFWRADDRRAGRSDGWEAARGGDRGPRRDRGSGWEDRGNGAGNGRADDRSHRAGRGHNGTRGAAANGGRFSQTADDLKNRLGLRGSALSRDRGRSAEQAADDDFWGESQGRAGGRTQGWRQNGARGNGAAGNGARGNGAAGNGAAGNGSGGNGSGGGYRGTRRANGASAGYGEDGTGQWAGRTALRERTARIQDGVRSRTATLQRGGNRGGRGGGGGWDGDGPSGGPQSRWDRFKRYFRSGDWWRHWTWKKVFGLIGSGIAAVVLLSALTIFIIYEKTPIPSAHDLTANWQSSQVFLSNGRPLGTFVSSDGVERQILQPGQIPTIMTHAMTAAEDRGFYTEGGISITGLLRSAYDDLFGSGGLQGGSTITMQYAKNYYTGVNTGQNATTKLKEIFIAMKLAHKMSKQWIMTQYLNTVPFGPTIYGVGAAAQSYFNVNLAAGGKLTYEQAAVLAAMPNAPGFLSPNPADTAGYQALQLRWHYVLTNMARDGSITQQQAASAKFPKYSPPQNGNGWSGYSGYLMQMVQQELEAPKQFGGYGLTQQQIDTGGYKITTTFSMAKVNALAHSVNQIKAQIAAAGGARFPSYDRIGSVLENAKTGAIVAVYGGPGYGVKNCVKLTCEYNTAETPEQVGSSFKPYVLATAVNQGMSVFSSKLNGFSPIGIPNSPANSATEHMLSVLRPPPGTNFNAIGFYYNNIHYFVFNEQGENMGALPVNAAAARSSDAAFEDLSHRVGIDSIIGMAHQLGVGDNPFNVHCPMGGTVAEMAGCSDYSGANELTALFSTNPALCHTQTCGSPQITLGVSPLTAVEQASTFATLANDGVYHTPHVIDSVTQGGNVLPSNLVTRTVLSPGAAADVDWALSFDNNFPQGTAEGNVSFRRGGVIGKTGTLGVNQNSSQAWFVGATPRQYAMSVALYTELGNGTTQVLNTLPSAPDGTPGSQGGGWPATIWNNFMTAQFGNQSWVPVDQVFPTVNGYPFEPWIQVKPQPAKLRFCKQGQTTNCKPGNCRPGFRFGQPCQGGNPTPNPTCSFQGQQNCTNPTPNPTQTCFPPGQCGNPSPSTSPSPTCPPPGPCKTQGVPQTAGGKTTARTTASTNRLTVAQDAYALFAASLAKLEREILVT